MSDKNPDTVEHNGTHYCFHDSEFWYWDPVEDLWISIGACPDFLRLIGDKLAVVKKDGRHDCVCPRQAVIDFGCKCGGD